MFSIPLEADPVVYDWCKQFMKITRAKDNSLGEAACYNHLA